MILKLKLVLILILLFTIPVTGQTASEIEKSFGKPMLAYSVTEHIWMTPDFAADGQVCRMRFHPKRVDSYSSYLDGRLKFDELKWILNLIVPPASRGDRKFAFATGPIGGGVASSDFEYEKVTFRFSSSFRIQIDLKSLREIGEPELIDSFEFLGELPKPPPPSEDDFDQTVPSEIVTLSWNDRTCAKNSDDVPVENRKVAEIEQKFDQPQKLYSVGTYTSMTPDYTAAGQVCRMRIYPKRVSEGNSYLGTTLQSDEVTSFLNTFFPPARRGLKQRMISGITTFKGVESAWTTYPYKNVSFTFLADPKSKPAPGVEYRSPEKSEIQSTKDAEIVIVQWKHRTCAP